jgi:hypothetical protein
MNNINIIISFLITSTTNIKSEPDFSGIPVVLTQFFDQDNKKMKLIP